MTNDLYSDTLVRQVKEECKIFIHFIWLFSSLHISLTISLLSAIALPHRPVKFQRSTNEKNNNLIYQVVDLATPKIFAISLIGLFWFFSLMITCLTSSDHTLVLLRVNINVFQLQMPHMISKNGYNSYTVPLTWIQIPVISPG